MKIVILSKTLYGGLYCIGGMSMTNNQYVRLLDEYGNYQPSNTEFEIGEVWNIEYKVPNILEQPHIEDVFVTKKNFVKNINNLPDFIHGSEVQIWNGSINEIFESKLQWTNSGSGYITISDEEYPTHSVGFWVSDSPLTHDGDKYYYYPNENGLRRLVYKGVPTAIKIIPAGTLIRVSLAKWWDDGNNGRRCYAQLSGCY